MHKQLIYSNGLKAKKSLVRSIVISLIALLPATLLFGMISILIFGNLSYFFIVICDLLIICLLSIYIHRSSGLINIFEDTIHIYRSTKYADIPVKCIYKVKYEHLRNSFSPRLGPNVIVIYYQTSSESGKLFLTAKHLSLEEIKKIVTFFHNTNAEIMIDSDYEKDKWIDPRR